MSPPLYWTMLTDSGRAKVANAIGTGLKINIIKFGVGDGIIQADSEDLVNPKFTGLINSSNTVLDSSSQVEMLGIVPSTEGGFYVREAAFYTEDNQAFAIVKYPETYKPSIDDNASAELGIKAVLDVVQAEVVNLKIDPSMVYATQTWVSNELQKLAGVLTLDGGNFTDSYPSSAPIDGGQI